MRHAPRRPKAADVAKFIDAHGGRLGAFRGCGMGQRPRATAPRAGTLYPSRAIRLHTGQIFLSASVRRTTRRQL